MGVHDRGALLWRLIGVKVRIGGTQAPDFESASPFRAAGPCGAYYRRDNAAARRGRSIV